MTVSRFSLVADEKEANPRWALVLSLIGQSQKWVRSGIRTQSPEDVLKQWLGFTAIKPAAEDFERGVNCLLFAAGCSLLVLLEADGVDAAIFQDEDQKQAFLISCTTGSALVAQMAALKPQANRAADSLTDCSVVPAIFMCYELRDLTLGALEDFEKGNMRLVLRSDLQDMFEMVSGKEWRHARSRVMDPLTMPHNAWGLRNTLRD